MSDKEMVAALAGRPDGELARQGGHGVNENNAQRIVRARALAWEALSGDEQATWLRKVDGAFAELTEAALRAREPLSQSEGASTPEDTA